MREFAIIVTHENMFFNEKIVEKLPKDSKITVFSKIETKKDQYPGMEWIIFPEEVRDSDTKMRNFVSKHYFDTNFKGFLHVIQDRVEILKDPDVFLGQIELMMKKLRLTHWFNTVTDECNYTFNVYNPRFEVEIDEEKAKSVYDKKVLWTSHSNTSWLCYDFETAEYKDVEFNEEFTIPMYYIIYFLAEKRNHKKPGELYYMNFYPTIEEERGVFRIYKHEDDESNEPGEKMEKEGVVFASHNINHQADMSIEQIMDDIYAVLTK